MQAPSYPLREKAGPAATGIPGWFADDDYASTRVEAYPFIVALLYVDDGDCCWSPADSHAADVTSDGLS